MTRLLTGLLFVCAAQAQLPQIGDINVYGLHRMTAAEILGDVHLATGETIPASRGELERQIGALAGVAAVQVQTLCCEGNRATLFVGIAESGERVPEFREAPVGAATLSAAIMKTYRGYRGAALRADLNGEGDEIQTAGHALATDATVRGFQNQFLIYARTHFESLRKALRTSGDAEERAAAAAVMGYSAQTRLAEAELLSALHDPDEVVRANAAHALSAMAALAQKQPALGMQISPAPFVDLLNSVVLSDRVECTKALLTMTSGKNDAALDLIRQRALPSLVEMARWKTAKYALPPFLLLGRLAGMPDAEVRQSWEKGDHEAVIEKASKRDGE